MQTPSQVAGRLFSPSQPKQDRQPFSQPPCDFTSQEIDQDDIETMIDVPDPPQASTDRSNRAVPRSPIKFRLITPPNVKEHTLSTPVVLT